MSDFIPRFVRGFSTRSLVFRLAAADLRHEWILSVCLVLALAAVIAPLLLIFGLKYGTIETLRRKLIQDPAKREIVFKESIRYGGDWITALTRWPEVGFAVPMTRQMANTVNLRSRLGATIDNVALLPTATGDPLLSESGAPVPGPGEAVLSEYAARDLGVAVGDTVEIAALAIRATESAQGRAPLRVVGVLSAKANKLRALYTPLRLLEAVEAFKDGLAVPEYGWEGGSISAPPRFDGAVVLARQPLPAELQQRLLINTGLAKIAQLDAATLHRTAGWNVAAGVFIYLLSNESSTIGEDGLTALRDKLRGQQALVCAWVRPIEVASVDGNASSPLRVAALAVTAKEAAEWGIEPAPAWDDRAGNSLHIALPTNAPGSSSLRLRLSALDAPLELPVNVSATRAPGEIALAPARLSGILRLARERRLRFDPMQGEVLLDRLGYPALRLYARSIDDVESLQRKLESQGLKIDTQVDRIREVTELDRHLSRLFWLIAVVGIGGGLAALMASLYASVERKRRDLSVLRLLGVPRWRLLRFPVYQSILLITGSFATALALFFAISSTIDTVLGSHFDTENRVGQIARVHHTVSRGSLLTTDEKFCHLPLGHGLFAYIGSLGFAAGAAVVAAVRVSRAQPADALREE